MDKPDKSILKSILPNEVMALTIYGEARGEPVEGQIAVANVIYNRFQSNRKKYPSIDYVCLEKYQFSCWNTDDPNLPRLLSLAVEIQFDRMYNEKLYRQCLFIVQGIMSGALLDNTNEAKHYISSHLFNSNLKPEWARKAVAVKEVGNHVFFNV